MNGAQREESGNGKISDLGEEKEAETQRVSSTNLQNCIASLYSPLVDEMAVILLNCSPDINVYVAARGAIIKSGAARKEETLHPNTIKRNNLYITLKRFKGYIFLTVTAALFLLIIPTPQQA